MAKMKIIAVGPSRLLDYDIQGLKSHLPPLLNIDIIIYWYEGGCYGGSGTIVYKDSNGDWHKGEIDHCSCFGPLDNAWNPLAYTKQELITLLGKDEGDIAIKNALEKLK